MMTTPKHNSDERNSYFTDQSMKGSSQRKTKELESLSDGVKYPSLRCSPIGL